MKLKLAFLTCLAASPSYGAVLAQYDFAAVTDANETTETFLSSSIDTNANTTASDITSPATHNSGAVHPEFGDIFNNGGNQAIGWSGRGNNPAQNFAIVMPIDTFISFDVNILSSHNLTSLTVLTGVHLTLNNTTNAYDYTLNYSTDGTNFFSAGTIVSGGGANQAATVTTTTPDLTETAGISFDLSGVAALQGVSGQVYFQLDPVASAGSGQNGVMSQRAGFVDDVVLNGTAVPEPSSTALLGLGGLALILRRKK
ncbi:MAG: PEP-CTERM sorting domain-containing protein [Akkermansiaceae bacterium]